MTAWLSTLDEEALCRVLRARPDAAAHAIDAGESVTISYVASSGRHTVRTLTDLELDPPYV